MASARHGKPSLPFRFSVLVLRFLFLREAPSQLSSLVALLHARRRSHSGMRGAAASLPRNCNSATPSTSAPASSSSSSLHAFCRLAAVTASIPPTRRPRRGTAPSRVVFSMAAASAPLAPTLKTYDAASMSTQDLLAFTARPRVDFDSILATVRFCLSMLSSSRDDGSAPCLSRDITLNRISRASSLDLDERKQRSVEPAREMTTKKLTTLFSSPSRPLPRLFFSFSFSTTGRPHHRRRPPARRRRRPRAHGQV